jgi:prepilin-type N-terminal cleavage/methylation domain-containing protein
MLRRKRSGFTLVEMLISFALLSLVMAAILGAFISFQRSYVRQRESVQAQETLQSTELLLTRLLRSARAAPLNATPFAIDPDPLKQGVFGSIRLRSDFNPTDGDVQDMLEDVLVQVRSDTMYVTWQAGAAAQPFAHPVQSMRFAYFATNGRELTTAAEVPAATRVKLSIVAPRKADPGVPVRRESWIFLRN